MPTITVTIFHVTSVSPWMLTILNSNVQVSRLTTFLCELIFINNFLEADCRYPDQVRLDIYTSWSLKSGSLTHGLNILVFVVLLIPNIISMY